MIKLWQEIRIRLLTWLACLVILALCLLPFANKLFTLFAYPLMSILKSPQPLIAIAVLSAFWIPIELSFWFALLLSIPILLIHIWLFIKPALTKREQRLLRWYLSSSLLLFLAGLVFCYTVVLPICLRVVLTATPAEVHVMPDIVHYLTFSFRLLLIFGLAGELPLVVLLLCQLNVTFAKQLAQYRRYVIIGAFVLGMIVAPDVLSQCFLALPLWGLFEAGLLLAKYTMPDL